MKVHQKSNIRATGMETRLEGWVLCKKRRKKSKCMNLSNAQITHGQVIVHRNFREEGGMGGGKGDLLAADEEGNSGAQKGGGTHASPAQSFEGGRGAHGKEKVTQKNRNSPRRGNPYQKTLEGSTTGK